METDIAKYSNEALEDGELSDDSDGGYTPLQRPDTKPQLMTGSTSTSKMEELEDIESDSSTDDDSSSGSDDGVKTLTRDSSKRSKPKKKRPTAQLKVKPIESMRAHRSLPKKYDIWTESLQEETLMENMRGFDVAKDSKNDRSVENYDFAMKYRLNGENRLKRRFSNSGTNFSDDDRCESKRSRNDGRSVKDRLGQRCTDNVPRRIPDLVTGVDNTNEEVAWDIASKLCEEKDDLLMRVVAVLGKDLAIQMFKETQRIENDGGMMIMNGVRRRTPGGVFFFLLKQDDHITGENKKAIFHEEVKKTSKDRKIIQACRRDQKVEELKKSLNIKDKELKPLASRSDIVTAMAHLKPDTNGTLSNPPPSPVTNGGQDHSPDYSLQTINHVNDSSPEKAALRNLNDLEDDSLTAYDDDILDMNCDDMDLF